MFPWSITVETLHEHIPGYNIYQDTKLIRTLRKIHADARPSLRGLDLAPGESSLVSFSISFADPDSSETRNYAHPTHFPLLADT